MMGLDTWRRAVSIMPNEEEYRLVREPRWLEQRGAMEGVITGLKKEGSEDPEPGENEGRPGQGARPSKEALDIGEDPMGRRGFCGRQGA